MTGSPTILLVDDDQVILAMYGDFLSKHGFRVLTAATGEEGLATLIEGRGNIDLVITDVMMARMDGWEFLEYIRKELKLDERTLPVIVMSAVESIDLEMDYIRHRANDWVTKPVRPMAKLAEKVRALLGMDIVGGSEDEPHGSSDGGS